MDENIRQAHTPAAVGHETTDVNVWAIGKFGITLTVMMLLSIGLLIGLFQYFQSREDRSNKAVDPVATFPSPQLVPNEPKRLNEVRAEEEKVLDGYGWVDRQKGVVRIPVDQAIEVLAKRGLPARRQAEIAGSEVSMPTESGLGQPAERK